MNLYIKIHSSHKNRIKISVFDKEDLKFEYISEDDIYESYNNLNDEIITDRRFKFKFKLKKDKDILDIVTLTSKFKNTYEIYLIYGEGYNEQEKTNVVHIINQSDKNDSINLLKYLYSDINDHQQYVKINSYYPQAFSKYFNNDYPSINEQIKKIRDDLPYYCVAVIIRNRNLIDYFKSLKLYNKIEYFIFIILILNGITNRYS